jgi:hypothetical protein
MGMQKIPFFGSKHLKRCRAEAGRPGRAKEKGAVEGPLSDAGETV